MHVTIEKYTKVSLCISLLFVADGDFAYISFERDGIEPIRRQQKGDPMIKDLFRAP